MPQFTPSQMAYIRLRQSIDFPELGSTHIIDIINNKLSAFGIRINPTTRRLQIKNETTNLWHTIRVTGTDGYASPVVDPEGEA